MSKITKLNNFGSTKGMDLKLIPVTGPDNRRWLMTSSTLWRHQACNLQTRTFFWYLVCKIPIWWRHNFDDVINRLLLSRPITGVSLVPIPFVDPEIWARLVKYRPVCRIHVEHDMTMEPIVTFSFVKIYYLTKFHDNWIKIGFSTQLLVLHSFTPGF